LDIRGQYDANKAKQARRAQERQPTPLWWLGQREPIARFTKWLVIWTALLFIGTVASAVVLLKTDYTLKEQVDNVKRQLTILEADQRPWIKTEISFADDLTYSEKTCALSSITF
jgi:hypothetical protein